jgi:type VI secretion system protein ImpC
MAKPLSFGKIDVALTAGQVPADLAMPDETTPCRIALLGDFTGRSHRGICEPGFGIASRKPLRIDRDNLEEIMAKLGVELSRFGQGETLRFKELDDFLPDRIYDSLAIFDKLRSLRTRLGQPATFTDAAAEVRSWAKSAAPPPDQTKGEIQLSPAELLEQIVGGELPSLPPTAPAARTAADFEDLVAKIARPYFVPGADPQLASLLALVDEATSAQMRAVLHHVDFQELEAAWRSAHFLTRRLDTDEGLHLYLIDISKAELAFDLSVNDLKQSGLYRLLVEQSVGTPGAQPWTLFVGSYTFDATRPEAELLGRISRIAHRAGAPFVAAAGPRLAGCASLVATPDPDDWTLRPDMDGSTAWAALRHVPEVVSIGLTLPRFLLRLPYGRDATPAERFDFEEQPNPPEHEGYLWGSGAVLLAYLLGTAFNRAGWNMGLADIRDVADLPMHVWRDADGTGHTTPCAEVTLTDRAAAAILNRGLIPLRSHQNRDVISLSGWQSLSQAALRRLWSR